jgi:hypothetical protein
MIPKLSHCSSMFKLVIDAISSKVIVLILLLSCFIIQSISTIAKIIKFTIRTNRTFIVVLGIKRLFEFNYCKVSLFVFFRHL